MFVAVGGGVDAVSVKILVTTHHRSGNYVGAEMFRLLSGIKFFETFVDIIPSGSLVFMFLCIVFIFFFVHNRMCLL